MNLLSFTTITAILCHSAQAVILYGAGNDANLTDPGGGLPFDTVARVNSAAGVQDGGSGVHLGGGYMLTAAHINNTELNSVTFDNSTFYSRDMTYLPKTIGDTDLKIFKLNGVPTVGAANLYTGTSEILSGENGYLVGWGRGRDAGSPVDSDTVTFAGGGTPLVKRWGTNQPGATDPSFSYTRDPGEPFEKTYTYDAIFTVLGSSSGTPSGNGDFEAAAGFRDSGSGFFQEIGGTWYLTGLTSVVENSSIATFGDDLVASLDRGNLDVFVRVSSYQSLILAEIPEPSALLLSLASLALFLRRRR